MTYKAKVTKGDKQETVNVWVDARLKYRPHAQCGVRFDQNGAIRFISYNTEVITIDPEGWLTCTGLYSNTTRMQISKFLQEYAPNITLKEVKKCVEYNYTINIYTGEVADLA